MCDLFGELENEVETRRGWTELDEIRRRHKQLHAKISHGEADEEEFLEFERIRDLLESREREAKEKWRTSFGDGR